MSEATIAVGECRVCGSSAAQRTLGSKCVAAIERGMKLHPWRGRAAQVSDLLKEIDELLEELSQDKLDTERIAAEALDVYVCAQRLEAGV